VRVTATNASGAATSGDKRFYVNADGSISYDKPGKDPGPKDPTPAPPAPPVVTPVEPGPPVVAPPVLGQSVSVAPVAGTVRVRRPGGKGYVALAAGESIPVGSVVDARRGRVRLSSALDASGAAQTGTFWGAVFKVGQRREGRGMTDLHLAGGSFAGCRRTRASGALAHAAGKRRRAVRRLWGRDRGGRFRTHGRDSVATVRGTKWLTVDRCDGTLTRVTEGKVLVRDLRSGRKVMVRAGRSHLARHRR
jgi:hypothetical protein